MKRVIFVGPDFTPSSLPPALRIRLLARHLPRYGWQPTVLTVDPQAYDWSVDAENERLLPAELRVIRTGALSIRVARRIGFGDIGMRSLAQHWLALTKLCLRGEVDLLCIPVPPYIPMLLGRLIHAQFGIPYVIDYIDPWVTDYYWKLPPEQRPPRWPLANALARIGEPIAIRHASHLTGVSEGTLSSVTSRYAWLNGLSTTAIPYGGEPADFAYLRAHPRPNVIFDRNDGNFHLSYTGACIPQMHATVNALFAAVRMGLDQTPDLFQRLRLHFVGTSYAANAGTNYQVLPLAAAAGIQFYVDEHPERLPYLDALQILLDSHSLVVLGSEEPHYTASKIFPYILAERPLLTIFHAASSVVTIVQASGAGHLVTYDANHPPASQVTTIHAHIHHWLSHGATPPSTNWEAFAPYTADAMAARLANAFDQAILSLELL